MKLCSSLCLGLALLLLPTIPAAQEVIHDQGQAAALLQGMVGTWRIQRPGTASSLGFRTIRPGADVVTLEWEENLQATGVQSRGYMGFDSVSGRYFMIGIHSNAESRISFLEGTPEVDGRSIRWRPVEVRTDRELANRNLVVSVMQMTDPDSIEWREYNNRWTFNFLRQ